MTVSNLSEAAVVEEALASGRDSASLLAAIVESSVDAIISKTLEGFITSWNLGAERMYGYEKSEVIGKHISVLAQPECRDELDQALIRIANGGLVEQHDTKRIRKDGTVLDVSVTLSPIHNEDGVITGAAVVEHDITRRLTLERERRSLDVRLNQSERLESIGRLAGGVAHDFNNLLTVILSYTSFVNEALVDRPSARADLEQIRMAANRGSALTHQLLAFARREVLQPQVLSLNGVVTGVEQLLRRTMTERVELVISLSADDSCVEADPGQLEQVLVNLVVNARDAMVDGGIVRVDITNVDIEDGDTETRPGFAAGRYVQLLVSDTGPGMDPSVLEHIFEPFFTTKPQGKGTGLGLPMVFGIVVQAGGDIRFSSELGVGTTCRILLPMTSRTQAGLAPGGASRQLGGTETVLVVDDEDALCEVTRRILARNGYTVLTAASGREAIALLDGHPGPIELLLTDVIMRHMLGKEVADRARELRPGLPVVFTSGYAKPVLGRTLGDGTVRLLEKPFSEVQLLTKVRDTLESVTTPA
jgi:PAS domain S-box-containing protein